MPSLVETRHVTNQAASIDQVLHALADPTRRQIVERLGRAPASVSALAAPLPMSLAAVLQHIHVLELSGVISTSKVGRVRTCRVESATLDALETWIAARRYAWERRLDRLADVIATGDTGPIPAAHRGTRP
jgi:DNA-binding transcriptional ArsR family regulator